MIVRRKSQRRLKAEQRFNEAVTEFFTTLGARPGSFYDFELGTPAGLLHVSVHDTWVATRFDDVAAGTKFTESCGRSSNPYSGKWNFHYFDTLKPEVVIADLRFWVLVRPAHELESRGGTSRMNIIALTDTRLAALHRQVMNEIDRRARIATNGHDPAAIIYGNELAKRALVVAAGQHSILLVGPPKCGKSMMRAVALELGLAQTYEVWPCPCGHRNSLNLPCRCTVRQIERHFHKLPVADITVEMVRPLDREMRTPGTALADMRKQIEAKADFSSLDLDEVSSNLLRAAVRELGMGATGGARP